MSDDVDANCDNGPNDWIHPKVKKSQFLGYGDPNKLGAILGRFSPMDRV